MKFPKLCALVPYLVLYSLIIFILTGCGGWSGVISQQKSKRKVATIDIAGGYSYDYKQKNVVVELSSTGVFTITGSEEYSGIGKWEITADNDICLIYHDKKGIRVNTIWYITDGDNGSYELIGGEGDMNAMGPMKRLK